MLVLGDEIEDLPAPVGMRGPSVVLALDVGPLWAVFKQARWRVANGLWPAATCFRPTCRQSASPGSLLGPVTRLWIEKIVPIDTLTSMLVEPSSGSYMITYLPRRDVLGQSIGSSSSSDATTHTRPACCTALRTVSRANRSSFCCRSPETFTAPAAPRMSVRPARRT